MSEIQIREPLGTFLYFFIGTCLLAVLGATVPSLARDVGDIMQEHIAGKTIYIFAGVTLLFAFVCALRNIAKPSPFSIATRYLVINPSNFVITLAFVAAAVNWGVSLSSYVLFPLVARGEIFYIGVENALHITGIAIGLVAATRALLQEPTVKKTSQPFSTVSKSAFWLVFASSGIFWAAFFGTLAFKTFGA
jgi:hypothetical protein